MGEETFQVSIHREEALPARDELPADVRDCVTIGEYIDLILRKTQAEIAQSGTAWMQRNKVPGKMHQGQVSALRNGHLPAPKYWSRYMAALSLDGQDAQFFRMVRNAAKLRALQTPASASEPLLEYVAGVNGIVVRLRDDAAAGMREAV